jgi:site-specific DNA recombinase
MAAGGEIITREYLRVSKTADGRERSIPDQQDDNRDRWPNRNFGDHYRDRGSASRYATKARGDFDALLEDLRHDRFGANELMLWEPSRGSRKVGEWVELIDLCELRGVQIAVTEENKVYDPANPRDRKSLLEAATDSEYETAKLSGRIKRGKRSNARRGGVAGGRPLYGYRRIYDRETGELVRQEPDPERAAVVRRIFGEYIKGDSPRVIAVRLNDEGVASGSGAKWTALTITRLIDNVAFKGQRVHRGEVIGQAEWDPILSAETWDKAHERRESLRWQRGRSDAHLLAGTVRCGVCGGRMYATHPTGKLYYGCREGSHTFRPVERLDAWVTDAFLNRLRQPDVQRRITATGSSPEVEAAEAQVVELRAELAEALELWRAKALSVKAYAEMERDLTARIAQAERAAKVTRPTVEIDDLPDDVELIDAWWDAKSPELQRSYIAGWIAAVVAHPIGRRRTYRMEDYTEIEWRDES